MLVSFVIPTYNRLEFLQEAIYSIEKQTINDYEIIVSENNCTDGTKEWLGNQKNIKSIYHEKAINIFSNWNEGIKVSEGKYIVLLTDDDLVNAKMVEKISEIDEQNNDITMIAFNHKCINEYGEIISEYIMKQKGKFPNGTGFKYFADGVNNRPCSIAMNRNDIIDLNCFNETYLLTASDSELIQKLSIIGNVYFENNKDYCCYNRVWKGALTSRRMLSTQWHQEIQEWCKNISEYSHIKLNYDFRKNKRNIIRNNYYCAIAQNFSFDQKDEIKELMKTIPLEIYSISLMIRRIIIGSELLLNCYLKNRKLK